MTISIETPSWQHLLRNAITDPKDLWAALDLDPTTLPGALQASADFSLRVPRGFVSRMKKGDPKDPLLLQILPQGVETQIVPGYVADPLLEKKYNPVTGVLHKYQGRLLVTLTSVCAVNCRYCIRRHFPYDDNNPGKAGWADILNYIKKDESIKEVILSGGDPLVANDHYLRAFITELETLPQVKILRFHTRLPVVLPERVTVELCDLLEKTRLRAVIVVHVNHAQELSEDVKAVLARLRAVGVTLLNQSVLLEGINADPTSLIALSERLFECGVLPYYLHVLDKVHGAAHFDASTEKARQLHQTLRESLPGYLVPRLVREVAGTKSKVPV